MHDEETHKIAFRKFIRVIISYSNFLTCSGRKNSWRTRTSACLMEWTRNIRYLCLSIIVWHITWILFMFFTKQISVKNAYHPLDEWSSRCYSHYSCKFYYYMRTTNQWSICRMHLFYTENISSKTYWVLITRKLGVTLNSL